MKPWDKKVADHQIGQLVCMTNGTGVAELMYQFAPDLIAVSSRELHQSQLWQQILCNCQDGVKFAQPGQNLQNFLSEPHASARFTNYF